MENPKKKFKSVHSETPLKFSVDPLEIIPFDCHDLLLQHFRGKEVLQLLTVAKKWNLVIGSSSKTMSKIKLKPSRLITDADLSILLESDRKYQTVQLQFECPSRLQREALLIPKFSSSLIELKASIYKQQQVSIQNLSFPKLKKLKMEFTDVPEIFTEVLKGASCLEEVFFYQESINREFIEALMRNETIKDLKIVVAPRLNGQRILVYDDVFFDDPLPEPRFKLINLEVMTIEKPLLVATRKNFNDFVLSSAETLTTLHISDFSDEDAKLIELLPALKCLKMRRFHRGNDMITYKPNFNIEALHCCNEFNVPPDFLTSLKALKLLKISWLNDETFRKILEIMPGLTRLETEFVASMNQEKCQRIFNEVRRIFASSVRSFEVMLYHDLFVLRQEEDEAS
jgi:hypothetical protein